MTIKELQEYWYQQLEEHGFEDIEDHSLEFKPLKKWSGISIEYYNQSTRETINILDFVAYQEPLMTAQNCFPENIQHSQYELLHSEDFDSICTWICRHGNRKIKEETVKEIWIKHLNGESVRKIGTDTFLDHRLVHRIVKILREWSFCE